MFDFFLLPILPLSSSSLCLHSNGCHATVRLWRGDNDCCIKHPQYPRCVFIHTCLGDQPTLRSAPFIAFKPPKSFDTTHTYAHPQFILLSIALTHTLTHRLIPFNKTPNFRFPFLSPSPKMLLSLQTTPQKTMMPCSLI